MIQRNLLYSLSCIVFPVIRGRAAVIKTREGNAKLIDVACYYYLHGTQYYIYIYGAHRDETITVSTYKHFDYINKLEKSRAIHAHDAAGITAGERSIELVYPGKPHSIIHETDRYIYNSSASSVLWLYLDNDHADIYIYI